MSEAYVYTFKEGLLSPMAHDLKLKVGRFELKGQEATFDASSLRVVWASGPLPKNLYTEIEKNVREDVLKSSKFPTIRFVATQVGEQEIAGELTLCGVTRPIVCRRRGQQVEVELDQREFGIKPFTAMLGTLKVKPVVKVQVELPEQL